MRKILFFLSVVMMLSSCVKGMDPYEGGDGARANINGTKCIMLGSVNSNNIYAGYNCTGPYRFTTSPIILYHNIDQRSYTLNLQVSDVQALTPGVRYTFPSGDNEAYISYISDEVTGENIELHGWLSFTKISPDDTVTEARFELEGTSVSGNKYFLRHGFFRLATIIEKP